MFPAAFMLWWGLGCGAALSALPLVPFVVWQSALLMEAWMATGSLRVARLVPKAARIQLSSYGMGLLSEYVSVVVLKRRETTIGEVREVPELPIQSTPVA
jgi:hypothetical protein